MKVRGSLFILFILCILVGMLFSAGCTQSVQQQAPTPTPTPEATTEATTVATPTPEPEPFPDSLAVGESFRYGTDETAREVTVTRYMLLDSYRIHHPDWGMTETPVPAAEGDQFLFVFVEVAHAGTEKELWTPYPGSINVYYNGVIYPYRADRSDTVTTVLDARGVDDYAFEKIYKTQTKEGFLIYEVPESLNLDETYIVMDPGNDVRATWKLA